MLRARIVNEGGLPLLQVLLAGLHLARPTANVVVDFLPFLGIQHVPCQRWRHLPQNDARRINLREMFLRVLRQIWIRALLAGTGIKPHAERRL